MFHSYIMIIMVIMVWCDGGQLEPKKDNWA